MNRASSDKKWGVPVDVLKLGLVSLLTDLSSEMIFSVFAIFFTTVAGASAALLGLIEGLADVSASSLDYLAGWASDRSGRRKVFALAGYGFSTLAKGLLLVSSSIAGLGTFRVLEPLGKSFRGPPRDAWLAAVADPATRGYVFGVHKALDKSGAVLGPLLAYAVLWHWGAGAETYRMLFWIALCPAVLSIVVLGFVRDQAAPPRPCEGLFSAWRAQSRSFKRYLVTAAIFSLAYFSFGFLLVRAYQVGLSVRDIALLYALCNLAFVLSAPWMGRLGDRWGRGRIILLGYATYLLMSLEFARATSAAQVIGLFIVYGVLYAIDEAQSKAFIADLEPERRASAIGVYNMITGLLYLPASLLAGALWTVGPMSAFLVAAGFCVAAMVAFAVLRPDRPVRPDLVRVHAHPED
jgi:MFS family permease